MFSGEIPLDKAVLLSALLEGVLYGKSCQRTIHRAKHTEHLCVGTRFLVVDVRRNDLGSLFSAIHLLREP